MNFRQLEYVLEVDRCGSINKAAQVLFVSQPAVSSAVRELEAELGFSVFTRSSKGITSTEEGRKFIAAARQIVSQLNEIRGGGHDERREAPMVLRISSGRYSFLSAAVIRFYEQELRERPRFSLHVNESGNADVVQDVFGRRADLGFIHVKNAEEEAWKKRLEARNMEHLLLFRAYSCVTFRKTHPLAQKESFSMEDIYAYPQIRTTSRMTEYCNYDMTRPFDGYERFDQNIYTNNRCTLYDVLSRTDAVFLGITARYVTEFHPDLVTVPFREDGSAWNLYCVRLKSVPPNPCAARFIQVLQTLIREKEETLSFDQDFAET